MSMIQHSSGNTLAIPTRNAFEQYAEEANRGRIVGDLLKFKKTEWVTGQKEDEVKLGTRFVADMDGILVGWTRWWDNKPTESRMGRILENFEPARRSELGDDDESLWQSDNDPKNPRQKDPWQFGNTLILKAVDGDQLYTFNAGSKGAIGMIGRLCGTYGKAMRQRPDEFPIVEIDRSFYIHKVYGKTYTPEMKVVGWAPKADIQAAIEGEALNAAADAEAEAEREDPSPAAEKKTSTGKTRF